MDTNQQSGLHKPEQPKKIPEDIFEASANPNTRLTPVDSKPTPSVAPPVNINSLASPPPSVVTPAKVISVPKKKTSKIIILMTSASVIIVMVAAYYIYSQIFTSSDISTMPAANTPPSPTEIGQIVEDTEDVRPSITVIEEDIQSESNVDTDKDGLSDEREIELGLNINNSDSDEDGLSDKDEVDIYLTDPFNPDSDGDGFADGGEVKGGYDPNGTGRLNDINRLQF